MTHFVKARKIGTKRYWFLGDNGRMVNRRVFALRFTAETAAKAIAAIASDNPGYEFRAQRIPGSTSHA